MTPLRKRWPWIAANLAVLATIVWLSLEPATSGGIDDGRDKPQHLVTYACLMIWFCGFVRPRRYVAVAAALVAMGGVLELLQYATHWGRSAEWLDFTANMLGVGAGWFATAVLSGGWALRLRGLPPR